MISTTRQRFRADSGRVSTIFTLSPILAPSSSWAMNFFRFFTYLRYIGCLTRRSTRTTTVFVILSEATMPTFSARLSGVSSSSPVAVPASDASAFGCQQRLSFAIALLSLGSGLDRDFASTAAASPLQQLRHVSRSARLAASSFFVFCSLLGIFAFSVWPLRLHLLLRPPFSIDQSIHACQRFLFAADILDRLADTERLPEFQPETAIPSMRRPARSVPRRSYREAGLSVLCVSFLNNASLEVGTADELGLDRKLLRRKTA